jgi:hypothetical protein
LTINKVGHEVRPLFRLHNRATEILAQTGADPGRSALSCGVRVLDHRRDYTKVCLALQVINRPVLHTSWQDPPNSALSPHPL